MSALQMIKRATQRNQALSAAQMAHLRHTAYRGIDTSAHQPPITRERQQLTYRGLKYDH